MNEKHQTVTIYPSNLKYEQTDEIWRDPADKIYLSQDWEPRLSITFVLQLPFYEENMSGSA